MFNNIKEVSFVNVIGQDGLEKKEYLDNNETLIFKELSLLQFHSLFHYSENMYCLWICTSMCYIYAYVLQILYV